MISIYPLKLSDVFREYREGASDSIEITLQHGFSPVNLLHIFRIPFTRNTSGWPLRSRVKTHLVYTGFDQNSGNCAEDKFGSNIMSSNV